MPMTKTEFARQKNRGKREYPEYCLAKHDTCYGCTFAAFEGFDPGCYFYEHEDELKNLNRKLNAWRSQYKK